MFSAIISPDGVGWKGEGSRAEDRKLESSKVQVFMELLFFFTFVVRCIKKEWKWRENKTILFQKRSCWDVNDYVRKKVLYEICLICKIISPIHICRYVYTRSICHEKMYMEERYEILFFFLYFNFFHLNVWNNYYRKKKIKKCTQRD